MVPVEWLGLSCGVRFRFPCVSVPVVLVFLPKSRSEGTVVKKCNDPFFGTSEGLGWDGGARETFGQNRWDGRSF